MKTDLKELAYAYAMLSHPTRLGVLQALASGPKSIAYLLKTLRQTPNTLGKHLRAPNTMTLAGGLGRTMSEAGGRPLPRSPSWPNLC